MQVISGHKSHEILNIFIEINEIYIYISLGTLVYTVYAV